MAATDQISVAPSSPVIDHSSPGPRLAAILVVVTLVVGFGFGFAASRVNSRHEDVAAGPAVVTSTTEAPTSSDVVPPPLVPTSSLPTTEPPPVTTEAPTTTTAAVSPVTTVTVVTTKAPVTTARPLPPTTSGPPPTTVAPAHMVVAFPVDDRGRLVIPRGGSATLTIANTGGQSAQWLVTGSGFTLSGPAQGTLNPGQLTTVVVLPPPIGLPPTEVTGTISVLGAINSVVPFVIPPA